MIERSGQDLLEPIRSAKPENAIGESNLTHVQTPTHANLNKQSESNNDIPPARFARFKIPPLTSPVNSRERRPAASRSAVRVLRLNHSSLTPVPFPRGKSLP